MLRFFTKKGINKTKNFCAPANEKEKSLIERVSSDDSYDQDRFFIKPLEECDNGLTIFNENLLWHTITNIDEVEYRTFYYESFLVVDKEKSESYIIFKDGTRIKIPEEVVGFYESSPLNESYFVAKTKEGELFFIFFNKIKKEYILVPKINKGKVSIFFKKFFVIEHENSTFTLLNIYFDEERNPGFEIHENISKIVIDTIGNHGRLGYMEFLSDNGKFINFYDFFEYIKDIKKFIKFEKIERNIFTDPNNCDSYLKIMKIFIDKSTFEAIFYDGEFIKSLNKDLISIEQIKKSLLNNFKHILSAYSFIITHKNGKKSFYIFDYSENVILDTNKLFDDLTFVNSNTIRIVENKKEKFILSYNNNLISFENDFYFLPYDSNRYTIIKDLGNSYINMFCIELKDGKAEIPYTLPVYNFKDFCICFYKNKFFKLSNSFDIKKITYENIEQSISKNLLDIFDCNTFLSKYFDIKLLKKLNVCDLHFNQKDKELWIDYNYYNCHIKGNVLKISLNFLMKNITIDIEKEDGYIDIKDIIKNNLNLLDPIEKEYYNRAFSN